MNDNMSEHDNIRIKWESHFAAIHKDIDGYISSHYQPPYVEHDLDLEDECDEDDLAILSSAGALPRETSFQDERFSSIGKDISPQTERAIDDFLRKQGETFSQMLLRMIDERNLKDSEVYKEANIDRRLFSKIRGDEDYIPSKKTAICFCMALRLDLPEARDLLEAAGYALSTSSKFDLIIMYLLERGKYNVVFANMVLEQYGESTLTR